MKKRNRWLRTMLLTLTLLVALLAVGACAVLGQAKFGKNPQGASLAQMQASTNFKNGEFTNRIPTPTTLKGANTIKIFWNTVFGSKEGLVPNQGMPTVKTDLVALDQNQDVVVWLGHSSYFIQIAGKTILVDPVLSDHAAPFSFLNKAFAGTNLYTAAEIPALDLLLITHDHWDHLDYQTMLNLMPKVQKVICPLGVGSHFEHWAYPQDKVVEADWNTALAVDENLTVHVVPARHFSGRSFVRNKTLWAGFVLETEQKRVFLSGDTGFGPHFAEIADRFKTFDMVMLDGGQYDSLWPLVHMTPEQAVQAAEILKAKALFMGHVGRFAIARHLWNEPFERAVKASQGKDFPLLSPKIGEPMFLDGTQQSFPPWWNALL